ncbi:MAG: hypothetical protein ABIP85_21265 [Chthoniobacteraceae bacterium]
MSFFQKLERSLSRPRLDSYRKLGGGDHGALCRYLWNIALCEALYPSLQILEVGFRNSVHSEIATATATPEWLVTELAFLFDSEKTRISEAREGLRKTGKPVTEPFLIAELSFGFWTSLLDVRYDRLWHKIIMGVFPAMPRTIRTRAEASSRMSVIRKLRNAAVHHHSIWHWHDLEKKHSDIHTLIEWVCPSSAKIARSLDRFPAVYSGKAEQFAAIAAEISR